MWCVIGFLKKPISVVVEIETVIAFEVGQEMTKRWSADSLSDPNNSTINRDEDKKSLSNKTKRTFSNAGDEIKREEKK